MGIFRPGAFEITDRAIKTAGIQSGGKLLDVGCGAGETAEYLEKEYGVTVHGIDISKTQIEKGLSRCPALHIAEGDGEYLDFPSFTFDGVLMECTLSVIGLQEEALHEAYCVLKKGGALMISDLYLLDPDPQEVLEAQERALLKKHEKHASGDCGKRDPSVSELCMDGAFIKEALLEKIENLGFKVTLWEDRTEDLKGFLAQGIMTYGSVEKFLKEGIPEGERPEAFCKAAKGRRTGYFLLIAQKRETV